MNWHRYPDVERPPNTLLRSDDDQSRFAIRKNDEPDRDDWELVDAVFPGGGAEYVTYHPTQKAAKDEAEKRHEHAGGGHPEFV